MCKKKKMKVRVLFYIEWNSLKKKNISIFCALNIYLKQWYKLKPHKYANDHITSENTSQVGKYKEGCSLVQKWRRNIIAQENLVQCFSDISWLLKMIECDD